MFSPKNVITYIAAELPDVATLEAALAEHKFKGRGSQELCASGWVRPAPKGVYLNDEGDDRLVVDCHGAYLVALQFESALLPGQVVSDALAERVEAIEEEESRKVYRKERLGLKDEIVLDLLPRAFNRTSQLQALVCPALDRVFVFASGHARAEELLNALREALGSLKVAHPLVANSAAAIMTHWVNSEELPQGWVLESDARLEDPITKACQLSAKGQELASDEIRAHLESGMLVKRLALQWQEQIRFVLDEDLTLNRLRLCDGYRDKLDAEAPEDVAAALETSVWMWAKELHNLTGQLYQALGGLASDLVTKGGEA